MKDKAQAQGQVANELDREHHQIARMNADKLRRKRAEKAFQKDELHTIILWTISATEFTGSTKKGTSHS